MKTEFDKIRNSNDLNFFTSYFSYLGLKEVPKGLTVSQSGVNRDLNSPLLPSKTGLIR